ncbi:hypothetical protein MXD59_17615 [Frankia sp. Ag45/Mut15]|uniref:Uncharacterized protein n=1 Tax=Frankia umida TaxID=573489 RepID=A0ABT0K1B0_9ACTN|nr:hypothetical protein [Frankia umida]MCK9877568.1 hypothetical protein [Frankia umida]
MITGSTNGKHDPTRGRLVPHAPSDPDPERDPGSAAEPTTAADDETRDLPRPYERPSLRPVDWNGDFSSTWNSRDERDAVNELSAQYEAESEQEDLDRRSVERVERLRERADAEFDTQIAKEKEAARRAKEVDDPRARLWAKLEGLGRVFEDEDASPRSGGDGSSGAE